ncbi:hypothetical protein [Limimaricola cinnabarinus]|jgi:hypothetical protein|uniref:Lipoprotein n=1 Tax=Limimaricola cinnabarinus TaxID=1125964 RepID=A0A2G1MKS9_9RHOB|nr:hypothetical protein [Limimaricola cinnabarinus]PHP29345.1 hypothetical protein CJ301_02450 [Limimaricola cinnabarinus]
MRGALFAALAALLAGCGPQAEAARGGAGALKHEGVETRLLDGDLVNFHVAMSGGAGAEDVIAYAECAAAQYALIRGYGFARHVRTQLDESAGNWRADAVYTISPALPEGLRTIDAEVTVLNCGLNGIPTV